MKSLLWVLPTTALLSTVPMVAQALEYGASNLGGSSSVTWVFRDAPDANGILGYACFTRDTIEAMSRSAFAHRYALVVPPGEVDFSIRPLNAIEIYPSGANWIAEEVTPVSFMSLLSNGMTDETGEWFADNTPVDDLGRSCVDGGMAGSIRHLEQLHRLNIQE